MKHQQSPFLPVTLLCLAPMLIWSLHFGVLYAVDHVACSVSETAARSFVHPAVAVLTLLALALLLGSQWLSRRVLLRSGSDGELGHFLFGVASLLTLLAALAVIWSGFGSLALPACNDLR